MRFAIRYGVTFPDPDHRSDLADMCVVWFTTLDPLEAATLGMCVVGDKATKDGITEYFDTDTDDC